MERPFEPGSSWLGFTGHERRPVIELYAAFRRPRNDADRSAGGLAALALGGLGFAFDQADGRLLLAGLGGEEDMIYAVPVGDDRVACAVLPNGGGHCGVPGPDGLQLGANQLPTEALVVVGLVADTVESVGLIVAGATHDARMGENAFGLRLERTHEADLEQVVLHRRDSTTNAIGLQPK